MSRCRKAEREAYKVGKPHAGGWEIRHRPMTEAELRAYRAAQPPDDRDFGARWLGDPPSWRSALYAKAFGE
jgi:hypothetical protein